MAVTEDFQTSPQSSGRDSSAVYRRESVWLMRALRSLDKQASIEDVVHETFARLAEMTSLDARHPRALLLRVATNILRDQWRNSARRDRPGYKAALEISAPPWMSAEQFDHVLVSDILRSLSPLQREVFVLGRFGGRSYAEISAMCGISVRAVVQMKRVEGRFRITEVWYEPLRKRALAA